MIYRNIHGIRLQYTENCSNKICRSLHKNHNAMLSFDAIIYQTICQLIGKFFNFLVCIFIFAILYSSFRGILNQKRIDVLLNKDVAHGLHNPIILEIILYCISEVPE